MIAVKRGRPLIFGEVLFDCFPDGREVLGGASFNVAWNLKAFGRDPIFISRTGEDARGTAIREKMAAWGLDRSFLQSDSNHPTGKVTISLSKGEPHFEILADQAYDHITMPMDRIDELPAFLYHGSLALRGDQNRATLAELKRQYPCPIFLDVNLRAPWWNREDVLSMIGDAKWLKLNDDECRTLFPDRKDLHACGAMILDTFNLEAVFLTLGSKGAVSFSRGREPVTVAPSAPVNIVDTVGAGDAFASVLLLGLSHDWPMEMMLNRAQDFASAIIGKRGATLQDPSFYSIFRKEWLHG